MQNRRVGAKLTVAGLLFALAVLVPVATQRSESLLMTDPYWRYQEALWARSIESTGRIWPFAVPDHSFLTWWVTEFADNVATPVVARVLADMGGIDLQVVQAFPLFAFPLVLSQALLAARVSRRKAVFPLAALLAVSYQFHVSHLVTSAHRGAMTWALLFAVLAFLSSVDVTDRDSLAVLAVLAFGFVVGSHTLPVASLLFFSVLFLASRLGSRQFLSRRAYLLIAGLVVVYYGVFFDWLVYLVSLFFERVGLLLSIPASQIQVSWYHATLTAFGGVTVVLLSARALDRAVGRETVTTRAVVAAIGAGVLGLGTLLAVTISPGEFLEVARTSGSVHPSVLSYQNTALVTTPWYDSLRWVGRLTSVALVGAAALVRAGALWTDDRSVAVATRPVDALLLAVTVQGLASVSLLPLFAPSGGVNPQLLGLLVTPVFGGYVLARGFERFDGRYSPRQIATICVVVLVVTVPAFAVVTWKPMTDGMQIISTTETDTQQAEWAGTHLDDSRLASDFTTLSGYYALGGRGPTHIPEGGSPAYSSARNAELLIETYYTAPERTYLWADAYLVRGQMERYGMAHRASITTVPNPDLGDELGRNRSWNKVHTTGSDETFVDGG